jgi:hypothetical protein
VAERGVQATACVRLHCVASPHSTEGGGGSRCAVAERGVHGQCRNALPIRTAVRTVLGGGSRCLFGTMNQGMEAGYCLVFAHLRARGSLPEVSCPRLKGELHISYFFGPTSLAGCA